MRKHTQRKTFHRKQRDFRRPRWNYDEDKEEKPNHPPPNRDSILYTTAEASTVV